MGQWSSVTTHRKPTRELLTNKLVNGIVGANIFSPVEIFNFNDVFGQLADNTDNTDNTDSTPTIARAVADAYKPITFLCEDAIAHFLELPDVNGASHVVFRLASNLGAYPCMSEAPVPLGYDQLLVVIALLTRRYKCLLEGDGAKQRRMKLLFQSLAVYDRRPCEAYGARPREDTIARDGALGNGVGAAAEQDNGREDYDRPFSSESDGSEALIPGDDFRRLVMLLLMVAPLKPQTRLRRLAGFLTGARLDALRATTDSVVASFIDVETSPGVQWQTFDNVISNICPNLFDGLDPLFERFLFSKRLDFSAPRDEDEDTEAACPYGTETESRKNKGKRAITEQAGADFGAWMKRHPAAPPPVFPSTTSLMNHSVLAQLSFFLPGSSLFRNVRPLYAGTKDGFSAMGFGIKVFSWHAPTILLVHGKQLDDAAPRHGVATFLSSIPPCRFPKGSKGQWVTFGLYLNVPWQHTESACFGDDETVLFQLAPVMDVFRAMNPNPTLNSKLKPNRVTFTQSSLHHPYLAVGTAHPQPTRARRRPGNVRLPIGPVSLLIDDSFECGVFNHDVGGSSSSPSFATSAIRPYDFQDRFVIDEVEVWGLGGGACGRGCGTEQSLPYRGGYRARQDIAGVCGDDVWEEPGPEAFVTS